MNAWAIVFLALGAVLVWWGYKSKAIDDAALLVGAYLAIKEVAAVPGILGGGGGGGSSGDTGGDTGGGAAGDAGGAVAAPAAGAVV